MYVYLYISFSNCHCNIVSYTGVLQDSRSPLNMMTKNRDKVWPEGIVRYQFDDDEQRPSTV